MGFSSIDNLLFRLSPPDKNPQPRMVSAIGGSEGIGKTRMLARLEAACPPDTLVVSGHQPGFPKSLS